MNIWQQKGLARFKKNNIIIEIFEIKDDKFLNKKQVIQPNTKWNEIISALKWEKKSDFVLKNTVLKGL